MGKVRSKRHATRSRARGQSLPLIGLMIAVIIGMVGLSVDVGNTFSEERRAVTAANAAALAGMNTYIARSQATTNRVVYTSIVNALNAHGIQITAPGAEPQPDDVTLEARYLDAQGLPISNGSPIVTDDTNPVPANVAFIEVGLRGRVDTAFARIVGRNDLPFNALAYAGTCTSSSGYYPITINTRIIDGNRFVRSNDPALNWREVPYDSPDISGRFTAMRVVVGDESARNFGWLRWRDGVPGARSAITLARSLSGEGNLGEGFEEAPWPSSQNRPDGVYPPERGALSPGDWVWGSTAWPDSRDVEAALNEHIRLGTRMILPIHRDAFRDGDNSRFHVVRFGLFVLLGQGQTGSNRWLDLLFLGEPRPQQRACLYAPTASNDGQLGLAGSVSFLPEYRTQPLRRPPIQYVVVLDVSGSMSANFAGQCDVFDASAPTAEYHRRNNGQGHVNGAQRGWWQCAEVPADPNWPVQRAEVIGTGEAYWWSNERDRRIYVAKKALERLIAETNMPGNADYDPDRPSDQMALVWFNWQAPASFVGNFGGEAFSDEPQELINAVTRQATTHRSRNPYLSEGGTNGAGALYRASLLLDRAPRTVTHTDGQVWQYKRAVIYITDGVSNYLFNPNAPNLTFGISDRSTYPPDHVCHSRFALEMANCQTTGFGGRTIAANGIPAGLDRPITQAVNVSEQMKSRQYEVFVVALSNIPDTGLRDGIASFPSYFFSARELQRNADGSTNVDAIMEAINNIVESGVCERRADPRTNNIPPAEFRPVAGLVYPNVGEVILTDQNTGTQYRAPIRADASRGGALSYRFDRLPAGSYRLEAYVFYRHPLDAPDAGPRRYSLIEQNNETRADIVVNITADTNVGGFSRVIRQDLQLRLSGDVCATS
ncbi:MAG: pilus assembly protein TadG-related protein [Oscillochloridaceae bacterium]|nr:pilus assembly protein TadG-related protein [Chloroflexaceae bacterium]MDW8388975.1 pilus assembly protein TadG-related protein [Oscillochloridaceae bacterium]